MGVYIKGMDYPEMLSQTITIMRDGRVFFYPSGQKIGEAVEVKKHGRLIDADALVEDLLYDVEKDSVALGDLELVGSEREIIQSDKDIKQNCASYVSGSPTVIEAEE